MGSNAVQKGGKRRGKASRKSLKKGRKTRKQRGGAPDLSGIRATLDVMSSRPFPGSQPPSNAFITEMGLKGVTVGPAHPANQTFTPQPYDPAGYKNAPTLINANLSSQVRNPMF